MRFTFHHTYRRIFLCFIFLGLFTSIGFAASKTWDGGGDGVSWNSANNWDPNGVPGATDDITIDCSCTVTRSADLTINGTLTIAVGSTLDMSNHSLFIGDATFSNATLTNNGTVTNIVKLENGGASLGLGNGPFIYNTGTIDADNLRIGTGTGGGYFTNTSTGVVNVANTGTSIHMDGTLCNTGSMYLQGEFFIHGGYVDCCGYIETPDIRSETKNARPSTFMCIDICTGSGADPGFEVGGTSYDSLWVDDLEPADISTSDEFTFICGFNRNGEPGPVDPGAPGGVKPNLTMWLKANSGASTSTDGDGVQVWSDLSFKGNFVQQLDLGKQPKYRENTADNINFNPVVDFDGGDDVMSNVTGILGSATYTDLNVYSVVVTDVVQNGFLFVETCNPKRISLTVPWGLGEHYWDAGDFAGDYRLTTAWGGTEGIPYLWSDLYSTTSGQTIGGVSQVSERNGLGIGSDNTASSFTGTNKTFYLGGNTALNLDGKIAEIAIYTGPINAAQHNQIESYLAIKYGITLDNTVAGTGDYIASDATLLWDADANSTYHYDVTGIGRDDDSGLEQQKSINISGNDIVMMDKGGSFPSDKGFVLWGNNNGATTLTATNKHPDYDNRLERAWKVGVGGSPGAVTVKMVYNFPGISNDIVLHVDADGDFTSLATNHPLSSTSGDTLIFENVTFSNGDFFTLGITQAAPGHVIDGLAVWLRADLGTTGDPTVTAWDDLSGNANNATASGDPQLVSNGINFNQAIDFDGTGDYFATATTSLIGNDNPYTKIAVMILDNTIGDHHLMSSDGSGNHDMYFQHANSMPVMDHAGNQIIGPATTVGAPSITAVRYGVGGPDNFARTDGASIVDNTTYAFTDGGTLQIGNYASGVGEHDGYIAEAILYNAEVSDNNLTKIESYLAIRYGITLNNAAGGTAGDYQASDATLLWDADVNTTYHNDVAGIGRDDDSALDQQRSISSNGDDVVVMDKGGAFSNDLDFILWGNDDGAVSLDPTSKHPDFDNILQRTWKVAVTGSPGDVTVRIIFANGGLVGNYALHVDSDADFTSGATNYPATSIEGDTISFANVPFSSGEFFTMGAVQRGPGDVTNNLVLWLKANLGPSTTTDNATVNQWQDQSGTGNHATTESVPREPTFKDNFSDNINFNPTVQFDDTDDRMMIDLDVIKDGTEYSVLVVGQRGDANANYAIGSDADVTDNYTLHFGYQSSTKAYHGQGNNDLALDVDAFGNPDPPYFLFGSVTSSGRFLWEYRDDNAWPEYDINTTGLSGTVQDWIGYFDTGSSNEYYDGLISEVIVYSSELTLDETERIQTYLAIKYGFWRFGNFVASDGTILWDYSINSAYMWDAAGIGRDDRSVLDQRKSINNSKEGIVIMDKGTSFANDLDFILWGNDNDPISATATGASPNYNSILDRTWKTTVNGTPGNVTVQMIYGNDGIAANYGLLIDGDGDFSSGATNFPVSSFSGDTITFTNVALADGDFFTLGLNVTGPGFVTADLGLWLRADAGTNTTTDGVGITSWEDQSIGGWDATGTGDAKYLESFSNYNPAINFTDDVQPISGNIERSNGTASTIFMVGNTGDIKHPLMEIDADPKFAYLYGEKYAGGNGDYEVTPGSNSIWTVSDPGGGNTTFAEIFEDGLKIGTQDKDEDTDWPTGYYYIGDDRDAGGKGDKKLIGQIAEVIYYDQQLTAAEQQRVETYLAVKYGITLDNSAGGTAGDYVIRGGTTVWDASDNNLYHNDVTGIGRDDYSALDQRKSFNSSDGDIVIMDKGGGGFTNNLDYVIWGHNGDPTSLVAGGKHPDFDLILDRKWKAGVNGTPGEVTVRVILGNTGSQGNYALHVDADGNFSDGNATNFIASSISGDTITFSNVTFNAGDFFTLGQVQRAPGDVTDQFVLWLKADGGVEEAVGNSAEDGDGVNNWVDQSGARTNDAVKSQPPTFRNNTTSNINYNPVIEFDGTDDGLDFGNDYIYSSGTAPEDGMTFFTVVKPDLTTAKPEQYVFQFGTYNNGYTGGISDDAGRLYSNGSQSYINTGTGYGPNNIVPTLIRYTWDFDDAQTIHVNGETTASDADAMVVTKLTAAEINEDATHQSGSGPFAIGRQTYTSGITNDNGRFLQGAIAELVGYKKDVLPSEYEKIESYLAIKYAITLDNTGGGAVGDYIASDGTLIWDADADPAYHNEIIAIGRDDKSTLYQKQSHHEDDSLRIFIDALASNNASNSGTISNDVSFIAIGHDGGVQQAREMERPWTVVKSRFEREWKVTNTNFDDTFSLEIEWDSLGPFDITQIRLLVDDDGDFSDAQVLGPSDDLTFSVGSIIVGGISTAHIPKNSTRFITIGSINRGVPLPIELVSFEATVNEEDYSVQLDWQTAAEIDNDFFTIEKSKDAQDWTAIQRIEGAGNSSERLSYTTVDRYPYSGTSYYRLKQTDYDGQFTYSNIRAVNMTPLAQDAIKIYPNPGRDVITLEGNLVALADFRLYNVVGQDMSSLFRIVDKGDNSLKVDISRLPEGVYSIKTQHQVMKFIKK